VYSLDELGDLSSRSAIRMLEVKFLVCLSAKELRYGLRESVHAKQVLPAFAAKGVLVTAKAGRRIAYVPAGAARRTATTARPIATG
jgi:hypothetical protein